MPVEKSKARSSLVYQLKIALRGVKPAVWRRIQVPSTYSFWDLHVAIQDAMGWSDSHLHMFRVKAGRGARELEFGIPDEDDDILDRDILPGWDHSIAIHLTPERPRVLYEYDFGDGWEHDVVLEDVLPAVPKKKYPICVDGRRACPPDDVGGVPGYEDFCRAVRDPDDPQHDSMVEWVGGEFDPDAFDPRDVTFDDPRARWREAFEDSSFSRPKPLSRRGDRLPRDPDPEHAGGDMPENLIPFPTPESVRFVGALMKLDPRRLDDPTSILTDEEVRTLAGAVNAYIESGIGKSLGTAPADHEDSIRFRSVSRSCIAVREKRGLSLKEAAKLLHVPMYRIRAVEEGAFRSLEAQYLIGYVAFLGLDGWFARWKRANATLARKLQVDE